MLRRICAWLLATCWLCSGILLADETRVLFVVGPSTHKPGTHEVGAGCRLLADLLTKAENVDGVVCTVVDGWPEDKALLKRADTIVFSGDRFPLAEMDHTEKNMGELAELMQRGCGILCFHYATGLTKGQVPEDGQHPLLQWMGGYFATRCVHHQSTARIFKKASININSRHPVLRGVKPFVLHDEPYINNYFGPNGIEKNVTPLMTSMLPPESPKPEVVAWAVERRLASPPADHDQGRGVGIVMPHFYRNWSNDNLRTAILNGIIWTARREVPEGGIKTPIPKLEAYSPAAVEPVKR
ncbi:MAG TPA: hypothetical protein DDW52_13325 [Planctomycetaceae bacterium]|nr:hypothetical protein [Planctomycetaceae bacterium]